MLVAMLMVSMLVAMVVVLAVAFVVFIVIGATAGATQPLRTSPRRAHQPVVVVRRPDQRLLLIVQTDLVCSHQTGRHAWLAWGGGEGEGEGEGVEGQEMEGEGERMDGSR